MHTFAVRNGNISIGFELTNNVMVLLRCYSDYSPLGVGFSARDVATRPSSAVWLRRAGLNECSGLIQARDVADATIERQRGRLQGELDRLLALKPTAAGRHLRDAFFKLRVFLIQRSRTMLASGDCARP
jgi:hypothetical protein